MRLLSSARGLALPLLYLQHEHHIPLAHLVAGLDLELLHHSGRRRRHVHRGLLARQRDQAVLGGDARAGLDQHLDDVHTLGAADVGDADFEECHARAG